MLAPHLPHQQVASNGHPYGYPLPADEHNSGTYAPHRCDKYLFYRIDYDPYKFHALHAQDKTPDCKHRAFQK